MQSIEVDVRVISTYYTDTITLEPRMHVDEALGEYFQELSKDDQQWLYGVSIGVLCDADLLRVAELAYKNQTKCQGVTVEATGKPIRYLDNLRYRYSGRSD